MPPLGLCGWTLLLIVMLWIIFVGGVRRDEMIVGIGVLIGSVAFLYLVWRTETLNLDFKFQDIVQGWRIPWYIVSGIYEIILVLIWDLIHVKCADSLYRIGRFEPSKGDPRLEARRVLATFYTTMAPNFIVIGIDEHRNRTLFHQLKRSNIPKMKKALGAQPGKQQQT